MYHSGSRPTVLFLWGRYIKTAGFNPNTGEVCAESETLPDGFEHWIVKFNTKRDGDCAGELEYRYYKAALAAGVDMSPSRLLDVCLKNLYHDDGKRFLDHRHLQAYEERFYILVL